MTETEIQEIHAKYWGDDKTSEQICDAQIKSIAPPVCHECGQEVIGEISAYCDACSAKMELEGFLEKLSSPTFSHVSLVVIADMHFFFAWDKDGDGRGVDATEETLAVIRSKGVTSIRRE